jgi:hydrogenase/urease accessory protein HupE
MGVPVAYSIASPARKITGKFIRCFDGHWRFNTSSARSKLFYLPVILLFISLSSNLSAHEVRPAFLQVKQIDSITYHILWKIPARGKAVPRITPVFPRNMDIIQEEQPLIANASARFTYTGILHGDIHGQEIRIEGLSRTMIDALVNIELLSGEMYSILLRPDKPMGVVPRKSGWRQVAASYLTMGIEHILGGIDHLLFVLALLLITKGVRNLVKAITAFTVAHSITLSLAALGVLGLPSAPVEAFIALSIVFLAVELIHFYHGKNGLTVRYPWIVAFVFGLLHGFGFAGALAEIGLPQTAIPAALFFFNVGVETGQLMFVIVFLGLTWVISKLQIDWPRWARLVLPYGIGTIASFWLIERVVSFF